MSVFVALAFSAYNLSLSFSFSFVPVTVFLQLHSVHTAMKMSVMCLSRGEECPWLYCCLVLANVQIYRRGL